MLSIDTNELEQSIEQIIESSVNKAIEKHALKEQLPPLLTRKEFMELVGISNTKCNELFHREDFPVIRDFGHPRVPTKELMEWISFNTEWSRKHFTNQDFKSVI
ncbi:DNA-binding protein [Alkalibacillus sp. S2W]|uniref:DNA-binding protein n=1 Tax=Alkalibacillus sp. S2W TaxID=3386553 RepID=UPI00398D47E8